MRLSFLFGAMISLALTYSAPALAQSGTQKVPPAVQTAYADRFGATAPNPTWDREHGNIWQAMFRLDDAGAASARFDAKGNWLETTQAVSAKEVPADARAYVLKHYPKKKLRGASRITSADNTQRWRLLIDGQRLFFDNTGHLLGSAPTRGIVAKSRRQGPRKTVAIIADPVPSAPVAPVASPSVPAQAVR